MYKFLSIFFVVSLAFYQQTQAQYLEIQSKGAEKDHYVSIKSHKISLDEKYPYMFSQLSEYKITIKDDKETALYQMVIYDQAGKELITNYDPKHKKYVHKIFFKCPETKTYYMKFEKKQH